MQRPPRRAPRTVRSGMALVIVLTITSLLLISALYVWNTVRTDMSQNLVAIPRIQAQYLAKGAIQLALLKARRLPTQLYDAAFYAVGKNPSYVHSRGYAHLSDNPANPPSDPLAMVIQGPAFLTGDVTVSGSTVTRDNVKTIGGAPGDTETDDLNATDGLASGDYRVDRYLNFFVLDLADRTVTSPTLTGPPGGSYAGQTTVSISEVTACPILGKADPFTGTFRILAMNVLGAKGNKQYGEEALRIVAEATVTTRVAGETRTWGNREDMIYKTRRR